MSAQSQSKLALVQTYSWIFSVSQLSMHQWYIWKNYSNSGGKPPKIYLNDKGLFISTRITLKLRLMRPWPYQRKLTLYRTSITYKKIVQVLKMSNCHQSSVQAWSSHGHQVPVTQGLSVKIDALLSHYSWHPALCSWSQGSSWSGAFTNMPNDPGFVGGSEAACSRKSPDLLVHPRAHRSAHSS